MYYRRYSRVDSRDMARRNVVIPIPARSYDPGLVIKRVRGLQLAATAIPNDQFCRGTTLDFLFLPLVDTNSRQEVSLGHDRRPSLILSSSYNWPNRDTNRESAHWPMQLL